MIITALYSIGKHTSGRKRAYIILVTIILTCFSGLRSWEMGDVFHYCYEYVGCNVPGWTLDLEAKDLSIGFQIFLHFAGQLGLSFENCLFIISAFVAISLGTVVFRYSPSPYWSYLMYITIGFYIWSFDILKQSIAMSFVMLAVIPIIEKKPLHFAALIGLAGSFHTPAMIFAIAYPFAHLKPRKGYFFIVASILIVVFLLRNILVNWMAGLYYDDSGRFTSNELVGGRLLMMVAILTWGLWMRPLHEYDSLYVKSFNIMILAIVFQIFSIYDNVFTRLTNYFYQFVVLYIPLILQPGDEQRRLYPNQRREIKVMSRQLYAVECIFVTVFAFWFYSRTVSPSAIAASEGFLSQFQFCWEAHSQNSLEMLEEYIASHP